MSGSVLRREHAVTDQALPHVLTESDEHLANPVATGEACLSPSLFIISHVDQQ
jgi:hypothetical protein